MMRSRLAIRRFLIPVKVLALAAVVGVVAFDRPPDRVPVAATYPVSAQPAHRTAVSVRYGRAPRDWHPKAGLLAEGGAAAAPFRQCPPTGASSGCAALIEVTATGEVAVRADPGQRPYDGETGATLVAVLNSSPAPVREVRLDADTTLFGDTRFAGPGVKFIHLGGDGRTGTVRFRDSLRPGDSAYFALAQAPAASVPAEGSPTRAAEGGAPSRTRPLPPCMPASNVNCATGALWEEATDVAIRGRGAALALSRTYSSDRAARDSRFGHGWTDSYAMTVEVDPAGAVTVTEENGTSIVFTRGGGGYRAPPGMPASLTGDPDTGFAFRRYADGIEHVFSASGRLTRRTDINGNTTDLEYEGDTLARVTDGAGGQLRFAYRDGRVATVEAVDPLTEQAVRTSRYSYLDGDLVRVTEQPSERSWTYGYDANHLLGTARNPRGGTRSVGYGADRRVVLQVDPAGAQTSWSYRGDGASPAGGTTTMTGPEGEVTVLEYASLELREVTRGAGTPVAATTRYTYGPGARVASVTDGNGHTIRYGYDPGTGDLLRVTDARDGVTGYRYTKPGKVGEVVNPLGATTRYSYNGHDNLSEVIDAERGGVTAYHYDDLDHPGDLKWVKGPDPGKDRQVTTLEYDDRGNVRSTTVYPTAGHHATTEYEYDFVGNLVSMRDPLDNVSRLTYNSAGLPEQTASGETEYDANGNPVRITDPNENVTRYAYDAADRLTAVSRADGSTIRTVYDRAGREVLHIDPAGQPTRFTYDALDRVASVTDPLGRTTSFGYDRVGNRTSRTDPSGRATRYSYDETDNLVSVSYSDSGPPAVRYEYDKAGRLTRLTDSTGVTTYAYDRNDRLTAVTNGSGRTVEHRYDAAGNQAALVYPAGTVTRGYDNADRLVSVTDWAGRQTTFGYDDAGSLTRQSSPNGIVAELGPSIVYKAGAATRAAFTYHRDPAGQVTSATSTIGERTEIATYTYDARNRVASAGGRPYGYDGADNLTALPDGTRQTFDAAGQLRTSTPVGEGPVSYGYDPRGNRSLVTKGSGSTALTYDAENRLTGYGEDVRYTYDGTGLRATATVGGGTASYHWDRSASLPLMLTDTANSYIYGPEGRPVAQIGADGTPRYALTDGQGSVRALTDEAGQILGSRDFDAFGRVGGAGTTGSPLGYTGQYTDEVTAFQYLRARYYDPATGQFLTRDPAAAVTREPFSYAGNNPLNAADPSGLSWWNPITWVTKVGSAAVDLVSSTAKVLTGFVSASRRVGAAVGRFAAGAASWVVSNLGSIVTGVVFAGCVVAAGHFTGVLGATIATVPCSAVAGALGGATDYLVGAARSGSFSWSGLGSATWNAGTDGFFEAMGELFVRGRQPVSYGGGPAR